jgi:hypothetical protein
MVEGTGGGIIMENSLAPSWLTGIPSYKIHWASEALEPQPEIPWVIQDLISIPSLNLIVGEGGAFKTYSMTDAGVCVAQGEPWLGLATTPSPVLFVDEESGAQRFARRLGDVMRGHGANADLQLAYTCLEGFDFGEDVYAYRLGEIIKEVGAKFVVIDALVDVMLGKDENLVKDVQPVMYHLRKTAYEQQCAIMLIHHANRGGEYRGSSALKGAVDLMLLVQKPKGSNTVNFTCEKARDVVIDPFSATANFEDGKFYLTPSEGNRGSHKVKNLCASQQYVLRFLARRGEASVTEIKNNADSCSANAAREAVYTLADEGRVERTNPGDKGEAIYRAIPMLLTDFMSSTSASP